GLPAAAELAALGVRRLSAGSAIAQAASSHSAALATAFLRDGTRPRVIDPSGPASGPEREVPSENALTHRELNALFARR
ncbi:MAG TPA: hypothetical protein VGD80_11045, partial [Kofleriaceae bacterium]